MRILLNEIDKHKSEKAIIKAAKTKLHQITGAFIDKVSLQAVDNLISEIQKNGETNEIITRILMFHASSAERINFVNEMYEDILNITGDKKAILDIACGLNPFYIPLIRSKITGYFAVDINSKVIELVNKYFAVINVDYHAVANDVLYKTLTCKVDNVFLFKILPLFEQQNKGFSRLLVKQLDSEFYTITFPTRSLSGKNKGMRKFYDDFMLNNFIHDEFEHCFEKEYFNEMLYIIRKRKN